jgi:hypothetical protein
MSKTCAWDGKEIDESNDSIEQREFKSFGKLCLYFCSGNCQDLYNEDKRKHGDVGVYRIEARGYF